MSTGAVFVPAPDPVGRPGDVIFTPLKFRNLTARNRIFRSNVTGRFDNYDGSGTQARINWEERFAIGGAGAILSSFVPVSIRGRVQPNYAAIDDDDKIPFWRKLGETVQRHNCPYILQLSHSGRQRDIPGVENQHNVGLSSTGNADYFHGLQCRSMNEAEIADVVEMFARGAWRAKQAGLAGVELHASHGYLFTQFLSSAINDRTDRYGGTLENRARFLREVIRAIRKRVGNDYFLGVKLSVEDHDNALFPWRKAGNTLEESLKVCRWVEEDGADALHVSIGSIFPHPLLPSGGFPSDEAGFWYGIMASSGTRGFINLAAFRFALLRPFFLWLWNRTKRTRPVEGVCAEQAREVRKVVGIPVINTGGYQDARLIRHVISEKWCDAVSIARPLIANPDLPRILAGGKDLPDSPCTFCNRCLLNAIANPLACYDIRRFGGDEEAMIRQAMMVFSPDGFGGPSWESRPAVRTFPAANEGEMTTEVLQRRPGALDQFEPAQLRDQFRISPVEARLRPIRRLLLAMAVLGPPVGFVAFWLVLLWLVAWWIFEWK